MTNYNTTSGKKARNTVEGITKSIFVIIQLIAILSMIALCGIGFYKLFHSIFSFESIYSFLKDILHSLEILFIAPIPILITFSFKKYILSIFPDENLDKTESNDNKTYLENLINPIEAKQAFVTSLIGITSTYLIGIFIELFTVKTTVKVNEATLNLNMDVSNDFIVILFFATIFLVIQILLYKILKH